MAGDEYEECLLKGSVLGQRSRSFELLETMRWTPAEGVYLRDRHLSRLRDSAEFFGFAIDETAIAQALAGVRGVAPLRLRLLVGQDEAVACPRCDGGLRGACVVRHSRFARLGLDG